MILGVLILACVPRPAGDEDLAGASSQELEEVLGLSPEQKLRLGSIFSWAADEEKAIKDDMKEKSTEDVSRAYRKLRAEVVEKISKMLSDKQKLKYDSYMSRKALFEQDLLRFTMGIPSLSELRIIVGISDTDLRKVAVVLDDYVAQARDLMKKAKADGTSKKDLASAIGKLRDNAIDTLVRTIESKAQPALQKFLANAVTPYEARLDTSAKNKLQRLCAQLGTKEPVSETRRADLAKILWHQGEMDSLRKTMARDIAAKSRNPEDVWLKTHEYTTLMSIHRSRLERLQREVQSSCSLKDQVVLIGEGLLPG